MSHGPGECAGWSPGPYELQPGRCRVCWVSKNPATRSGSAPAGTTQRIDRPARISLPTLLQTQPCAYLGGVTRRPQNCSKTWVYKCDVFGECTPVQCETCDRYRTAPGEPPRHLCYYLYPVAGNDLWRGALDNILDRFPLFTGRRIISIATQSPHHQLVPVEEVRKYIDEDADLLLAPHGPRKLGEVTAFVPMLERIRHLPGYTFYAHSKGVTKDPKNPAVHRWANMMYCANLDRWDRVEESLAAHPITGAFRKVGKAFGGRISHHYTGTFYWFRNADVFARKTWKDVPARYGGTEMWPGMLFQKEECGCHFLDASGHSLYHAPTIDWMERKLEQWLLSTTKSESTAYETSTT